MREESIFNNDKTYDKGTEKKVWEENWKKNTVKQVDVYFSLNILSIITEIYKMEILKP